MERHQRIQLKTTSRSTNQPFKVSPFQTRGLGVQQKAASTPASKSELWENYQRSTQMTQKGSHLPIQAKLTIGQPGDKYEQEADSVADRVMAMSEPAQVQREELGEEEEELQMKQLVGTISPLVQREELPEEDEELQMKPSSGMITPLSYRLETEKSIQAKCEECDEEPIQLSAADSTQVQPDLESRLTASKGSGSPLPDDVRSFMEPRFGSDFSGVRVHTGSDAIQMNQGVNAQAFAHGQDIYFGAGKAPGKDALTAHELTHVVQQTGAMQLKKGSQFPKMEERNTSEQYQDFKIQRKSSTLSKAKDAAKEASFLAAFGPALLVAKYTWNYIVRYGNWCGPGGSGTCIDDIDKCCKAHDEAYSAVGVTSTGPGIDMWEGEGLKRTMWADISLVACILATQNDGNKYSRRARIYQNQILALFTTRIQAAEWLNQNLEYL